MGKKLPRLLFICTANQCRSPAFEKCLDEHFEGVDCRSAGTDSGNLLNEEILAWADRVIVMELRHWEFIEDKYPQYLEKVEIIGLRDVYFKDDPKLREVAMGWALRYGFRMKK